jgi:biotin-dependent carboxylase-like uncharacterized protein
VTITILKPGLQTTIQSRPRTGLRHQGVPGGGAADPLSLALANRLVGNAWDAPAFEATLLGPTLRFDSDCAFAIAGATCSATLDGREVGWHETVFANAGDELQVGPAQADARTYIAFAGGIEADSILGAASTNLQAGFGGYAGRALQAGDVLSIAGGDPAALETPPEFRLPTSSSRALRTCVSAETDLLDETSLATLFDTNWVVDRRADRMGLRLDGPALSVASEGRMPSAAVFPGTVQCPEDGAPYILSVDAGTVGGYPRIAQVARVDRHVLGQLRPGDHVRLLRREPDEAVQELREKIAYWSEWLPDAAQVIG